MLRDEYGADLVSLWVENSNGFCGVGWPLENTERPRPDLAFSVVARSCATGYYSFGHEMGHNMGAGHAVRDPPAPGAFPFSFGLQQTVLAPFFRTIMAYDCAGGCPRINYWSNPNVEFSGIATGMDDGIPNATNNAMALNLTRSVIVNYRPTRVPLQRDICRHLLRPSYHNCRNTAVSNE